MSDAMHLPDPVRRLVRLQRGVLVGGAALLVGCGVWAFWPVSVARVEPPDLQVSPRTDKPMNDAPAREALDTDVFRMARLWNPPPEPPPPPPEEGEASDTPEVIRPPNLRLVGIIEENGVARAAALFNADDRKLLIVRAGDLIAPYAVESIGSELVILATSDNRRRARFSIHKEDR